jgi:hypothetical protein
MRTSKLSVMSLAGAVVFSFSFGLGEHRATGDPINNCVQSRCDMYYCWYAGTNGTHCMSAQVTGATYPFAAGKNSLTALLNIWGAVDSGWTGPLVPGGNFDRWDWPDNTPTCAKNAQGNWPAPQPVTPTRTPTFDAAKPNNTCTVPSP